MRKCLSRIRERLRLSIEPWQRDARRAEASCVGGSVRLQKRSGALSPDFLARRALPLRAILFRSVRTPPPTWLPLDAASIRFFAGRMSRRPGRCTERGQRFFLAHTANYVSPFLPAHAVRCEPFTPLLIRPFSSPFVAALLFFKAPGLQLHAFDKTTSESPRGFKTNTTFLHRKFCLKTRVHPTHAVARDGRQCARDGCNSVAVAKERRVQTAERVGKPLHRLRAMQQSACASVTHRRANQSERSACFGSAQSRRRAVALS